MSTKIKRPADAGEMSTAEQSPPAAATSTLSRLLADQRAVSEGAEEILRKLAPGQVPTSTEWGVLRLAGIATRDDLERQCGRVANVKRWLALAGTATELAEAERAAIDATKADKEQRPALEQKLEEIQAELNRLAAERTRTREVLEKFRVARERLREPSLLPAFIREDAERAAHSIKVNYHERVSSLEAAILTVKSLQEIDLATREGIERAKLYCQSAAPECIRRTESKPIERRHPDGSVLDSYAVANETLSIDGFRDHRERLAADLPRLESELAELLEQRDAELAKAAQARDYYVERIS